MSSSKKDQLVLGLDLGTSSVGWALISYEGGKPVGIEELGSRIFPAGVEGDIESGRDESRNLKRRGARQQRRQAERRARRTRKIANALQQAGLLPEGNLIHDPERDEVLKTLDRKIYARHAGNGSNGAALDQLPYFLRARALDKTLEPHELGRALFHLSQRRGFLSNRKAPKDDDEEGQVKKGISELHAAMEKAGSRTLGEYFAGLDPHAERIRSRWTARSMYLEEFEKIWEAQQPHHADILTPDFKERLHKAIFHQRPLKSQSHLIGKCELEPTRKRAPWALLSAQRFRLLQKVNDLRVVSADGRKRDLTPEERQSLAEALERQEEMKFTSARKLLKLKGTTFSHEEGGETKLVGNRTAAKLRKVFGGRWEALNEEEKDQVVEDLLTIQKDEVLVRRGMGAWGLDEEAAQAFGAVSLESTYCALSRQALARLLPHLEAGTRYATALKEEYGEDRFDYWATDLLPMLQEAPIILRNPVVERTLTELRKVVNALIEKHGKPDAIRIELARDVKKPRKERKRTSKKNRDNQKARLSAAKEITAQTGDPAPRRDDILKVQLAHECNWVCPYTGRPISMGALVGEHPQFDIEHIIPYSRCLDNSFMNKTLCYHEENRSVKGNKTPYETYSGNPDKWDQIIERVKRFNGSGRNPKLDRFRAESLESFEDFSNRQLNDTRYASTLAANYLGLLYGGQIDKGGKRRIQAGRGQVTAELRRAWRLNGILNDGGTKTRDDHRHHAVDAVAIALTDARTVQMISRAAQKAKESNRKAFWKLVQMPWESFLEDVTEAVHGITVSHRPSRKVNGPLHEETFYSKTFEDEKGNAFRHVRKRVENLSKGEVEAIVDDRVRERVKKKLAETGGDPKKLGQDPPYMRTNGSRPIPIRKVRIRKRMNAFTIGKKHRARNVAAGSNHHMEILEVADKKGGVKWEDVIVSRYDAMCRLRKREDIVQRDHGPDKHFLFTLACGDIIELDDENGGRKLCVVRTVSKDFIAFAGIRDARLVKDIKAAGDWKLLRLNGVRRLNCQKMAIDALGRVRRAND